MHNPVILKLSIWLTLWGVVWLGFHLMNKKGIDFIKYYPVTILYFSTVSAVVILLFLNEFRMLTDTRFEALPFISLLLLVIINISAHRFIKNNYKKPEELIKKNPNLFFLRLDYRYRASKSFEIMFQQTMIILLIVWLRDLGLSLFSIILIFSLIFGIGHITLIFSMGKRFGSLFIIAAIASAVIFPIPILYLPWGFAYSYITHWLFYIIISLFFCRRHHIHSQAWQVIDETNP
jgi:hypothetical protein